MRRNKLLSLFMIAVFWIGCAICLVSTAGCDDNQITILRKTCRAIAESNDILLQDTKAGYADGLIDKAQAEMLATISIKVAQGNESINQLIVPLSQLPPEKRAAVKALAAPVLEQLKIAVDSELVGVKNPALKAKILAGLAAIKGGFEIILTISN